jgi:hypothetical protein
MSALLWLRLRRAAGFGFLSDLAFWASAFRFDLGMPFVALLLCFSAGRASAGKVETLDGSSFEGKIQFDPAGGLVVTPRNSPAVPVALSNLFRADFSDPTNHHPVSASPRLALATLDENKGALPQPWRGQDIGPVLKRGTAAHYHGSFSVEAHPRSRKAKGDALFFVYQNWGGDGEIVARVASLDPRDAKEKQARAGLMMRTSLEPESANVSMSLSGGLGSIFRRFSRKGEKVVDDKRPDLKPPYWVKLARENGTIAGYQSTDGQSWKLIASSETDLPERMFIGLAVTGRRKEPAHATFDHVALHSAVPRSAYTPRIVLRDGTTIADHLTAMDDSGVQFSKEKPGLKVRTANVARLLFQPDFQADSLTRGRTGLLMSNGDFIDGEIRGLEAGRVKISSVLFGQRTYELNRKVAAVVLRDLAPRAAEFEVATHDGSIWRPQTMKLAGGDSLQISEPLAGTWNIPLRDLTEIRRPAPR